MKYPSGIQPSLTYLNFLHKLFELFELLNAKIKLLLVQKLRMYSSNSLFWKDNSFFSLNASKHKTLNEIVFSQDVMLVD